ncbi:hypothetical protein ICW40_01140 [Actinotalea ferrariae]|uniref:hypothetical protein n=1 Tax=Actinotalea ferrariae TaxID=1386098 RepID=UPI001C8B0FD4|nr:hypothetical protein [Actinotalea ferrariae]MBX9243410.1 hypothetical protein [Actinotalea ferrariae]
MSTAPWLEAAREALPESLFHDFTITAHPVTGDPFELDVDGTADVVFDEAWSPHVQLAQAPCKVPEHQAALDALDPRAGTRVTVAAGYVYPGGRRDVHQLADLALRERPVERPANTMSLHAVSDEMRLQDTDPLGASHTFAATTLVRDAIMYLIGWLLDPDPTIVLTATSTRTLGEPLTVQTGANLWSVVVELQDRIDAWVYVDGARTWHVTDRPHLAGVSAHQMHVGPGGTVTASTAALDVREWGNAVLLQYPDDTFAFAQITTGPLAVGTVPTKVVKQSRTVDVGSTLNRWAVAETLLRRVYSRGRGFTLTAVAAYWLRPGHTVTVQLPTGPQERHLVARVTFHLGTGRMTVVTRVPDDTPTITTGA